MESATRRLAEVIGAALIEWARSSSVRADDNGVTERFRIADRGVCVRPDEALVFNMQDPRLDLPLPQLAHILDNASRNAASSLASLQEMWEWVRENGLDHPAYIPRSVSRLRASMQRNLTTTRDSLAQMAQLVRGEDLDTGCQDNLPLAAVVDGATEPEADVGRRAPASGDLVEPVVGDPALGTYEVKEGEDWETKEQRRIELDAQNDVQPVTWLIYKSDENAFRRWAIANRYGDSAVAFRRLLQQESVRFANVYSTVKAIQADLKRSELPPDHQTAHRLQEVLNYIKESSNG